MTFLLTVTDGTESIPLKYDSVQETEYIPDERAGVGASTQVSPLWHIPDRGEPRLLSVDEAVRVLNFQMSIRTDAASNKNDEILNSLIKLERMVGPQGKATRFNTQGTAKQVFLRVRLENSTNHTDFPIYYGEVSGLTAVLNQIGHRNDIAHQVSITLNVRATGWGNAITISNEIPASTSFTDDGNGDGRADGWSAEGSPTFSLEGTSYLVGGSSQKFVTDNSSTAGIISNLVSSSSGVTVVAAVWVRSESTSHDELKISIKDGSGDIVVKTFDPSNPSGFDTTQDDLAGNTWYRYTLSSTTAGTDPRLRVARNSADASIASTYYVDAAYLELNRTDVPSAYVSSCVYQNSTTTNVRNYIDTWGIPGDARPLVDWRFKLGVTGFGGLTVIAGGNDDGQFSAGKHQHYYGSSTLSLESGSASISTVADANVIGGNYKRVTSPAAGEVGKVYVKLPTNLNESTQWFSTALRAFAIVKQSNINSKLKMVETTRGVDSVATSCPLSFFWSLIDLGVLTPSSSPVDLYAGTSAAGPTLELDMKTNGETIDLNGIFFIPYHEERFMITEGWPYTDNNFYILGTQRVVYADSNLKTSIHNGSLWTVAQGDIATRTYFLLADEQTLEWDNGNQATAELTIIPRTRHLLGTV